MGEGGEAEIGLSCLRNVVMNINVPQNAGNFLIGRGHVSFSTTLFHGVMLGYAALFIYKLNILIDIDTIIIIKPTNTHSCIIVTITLH
jgi:hypothetical protein